MLVQWCSQHYWLSGNKIQWPSITIMHPTGRFSTFRPANLRCYVVSVNPHCYQSLYLSWHSLKELTKIMKHLR
jgi:hypothetical protein